MQKTQLAAAVAAVLGFALQGPATAADAVDGKLDVKEKSSPSKVVKTEKKKLGEEGSCKGKDKSCKGKDKSKAGKDKSCKGKEGSCKGKDKSCKAEAK